MPDPLAAALGRIAHALSGTLEVKDVFARVAEAAATVLPFDTMGVARLESPDAMRLYAMAGSFVPEPEDGARALPLADFSPALRPHAGGVARGIVRIGDAARELDPIFPVDRKLLDHGVRSLLRAPLLRGGELAGTLWFTSRDAAAFAPEHEAAAAPIADLLGLVLEHERLFRLEASRRGRLDAIDTLLLTLAGTLDVRGIFNQVSDIVQPVLAHDRLVLTSLSDDRTAINLDAISGEPVSGLLESMPVCAEDEKHGPGATLEPLIITDLDEGASTCERRPGSCLDGIRSLLRIPLRVDGGVGWLVFLSRTPRQYGEDDVVVARRVADHVSLALSHQRLAEEERRAAEARERASRLEERVAALRDELDSTRGYHRAIGESKQWKDVLNQAAKVAPTETTVLLTGESGTGKEVVAHLLHRGSPRAAMPFVALNCAALPEPLLESELFGHEKGAFTGATAARPGRLEQAAGGVLFLDEVGEMSTAVQAKLLRVLQEREFQRLGGSRTIHANVRVVAATNRDLARAMARGEFREDLYYRLRVFEIRLPPLRERPDDIIPLAEALLERIGAEVGRPAAGISRDAREALLACPWPGNVRELRNALERATILCDGGLITSEHLPIEVGRRRPDAERGGSAFSDPPGRERPGGGSRFPAQGVDLRAIERDLVLRALAAAGNNRSRAARLLGITRAQLYSRLERHGIDAGSRGPASPERG